MLNEILLNNQVLVYLLSEAVLFVLALVAFVVTVGLLRRWDFGSFSQRQFGLERRAYLVMSVIGFVFVAKLFLVIYFVYTIDALALLVPGAMCAAGVISANGYGLNLLFVKLVILFVLLLWVALNRYDLEAKSYPIFRAKSWLFVGIFALLTLGLWLDISYFIHIDITVPVSCCSALFGQLEGANPLPFGLDTRWLLILFYALYAVNILSLLTHQKATALIASALFVFVGYYAVVYFFGTYVYELPTHKCPFCMMQRDYYYVGYLIWGTLFVGTYETLIWSIMGVWLKTDRTQERQRALWLLSIFVLVCSAYVVVYYVRNGVFL